MGKQCICQLLVEHLLLEWHSQIERQGRGRLVSRGVMDLMPKKDSESVKTTFLFFSDQVHILLRLSCISRLVFDIYC